MIIINSMIDNTLAGVLAPWGVPPMPICPNLLTNSLCGQNASAQPALLPVRRRVAVLFEFKPNESRRLGVFLHGPMAAIAGKLLQFPFRGLFVDSPALAFQHGCEPE